MQLFRLLLASAGVLALSAAANPIAKRQSAPAVNCGGNYYSSDVVSECVQYADNSDAPSSDYPHTYNDYEGFDFSNECSDSSYEEYPLTQGGYTGGSPGADRCIVGQQSGQFCGAITHTGASSYDGFVQCQY